MADNDRTAERRALAFHSGVLKGMLETSDIRELDRDTLEYVANAFNESVDRYDVDSTVIHVDPDTGGGD